MADNDSDERGLDDLKAIASSIAGAAGVLLATQRVYSNEVREKSLNVYARLIEANMLATGVIGSVLSRSNGRVSKSKREAPAHDTTAQIAAFVIGLDVVESAISEGRYLQASALLRQEMEGLAALDEIRKGVRKHGKAPNVQTLASVKHLYGDLSAATHLAKASVVAAATEYSGNIDGLPEETVVWRYFPEFDGDLARKLYALHTLMMLHLAEHIRLDLLDAHEEDFTEDETQAVQQSLQLLLDEKCLVVDVY